ncbi:negative regulator of the PHO system [Quaeritorhiza haematococci]|nr:negative regulator of the PHO system [Quaeritorhiza haematococci]
MLGTPTEKTWPGVTELPDYKPDFPQYPPASLGALLPKLQADSNGAGIDLLSRLVEYQPEKRISAEEALRRMYRIFEKGRGSLCCVRPLCLICFFSHLIADLNFIDLSPPHSQTDPFFDGLQQKD